MNMLNQQPANHERSKNVSIVASIVVVEDSPTILHAICALLEIEEGIEIVGRAADGEEAMEAVESVHPEFVLMDVSMPRMNGLVATRLLARHFPGTRVLLMSSEDSPQLRDECLACGALAFIYKPRFRTELLAAVQASRKSGKIDVQDRKRRSVFSRFSPAAVAISG